MQIISLLYKIVLDALFPLSLAEEELVSMRPEEAIDKLPPAPGYEGLAVDLPNTRSIFAYKDELTAKLIWNIKYKKSKHAVQIGGYALWYWMTTTGSGIRALMDTPSSRARDAAGSPSPSLSPKRPENPLPSPVVIIPMPITKRRRRERGYNQCELLVDEIARLDLDKRFRIEKTLLIRTHHASRQTLKSRDDRVESAKGIFGVNEKMPILSTTHTIIVIDDVITTGSTMFEAIETLKKAGFVDVRGLSLAH